MTSTTKQLDQRRWRQQYGLLQANRVTLRSMAALNLSAHKYSVLLQLIDEVIDNHNARYRARGLNIPTEEERRQRRYDALERGDV